MKSKGKQSFLQGAGILTLATVAVKIIGALYKIPLYNIIGKEGNAYFTQAYNIYSFLLVVSTVGLPVAISRMISEAIATDNLAQARRIEQISRQVLTVLGLGGALVMVVLCKPLAVLMGVSDGWLPILALGPALLFVGINSAYRGISQGQSDMTPTGVSQIIEAACKLVLGLLLAFILKKLTDSVVVSVAGAILGVTIGSALAYVYLLLDYRRGASSLDDGGASRPTKSKKATFRELLEIAIPITIGGAGLQAIMLIDSALVMHRLTGAAGLSDELAKGLYGLYGSVITLFGLPTALVSPFTISVVPAISMSLAQKRRREALRTESSAIRIMSLVIIPCAVGFFVLSEPIIALLYPSNSPTDSAIAGTLLMLIAPAVFFNGLTLLLNAIMQAHGFVTLPVINMLVGGVLKIITNLILVGMPGVNIYGAPIGTAVCFLAIMALDIFCIRHVIRHPPRLARLIAKPMLASVLMGVAAALSYRLLSGMISARLATVAAIAIAVVVYAVLVLALGIITYEDCMLLPKGEKIAKILHIS